ncbi:MAG: tetratricopeptide repeat protein [Cyanobacteria bacterium P01_D01_bin.1]
MSEAELFTELINLIDIDPFALIGVPVSADEKRVAKRYRTIAKQLHPDVIANAPTQQGITPTEATEIIARIVNPSYHKLKQDKRRQEILSMLRLRMRRLARSEKLIPTFEHAKQLANVEANSIDTYYEQAIGQLSLLQFAAISQLHSCSLELGQLNLIYLSRKTADINSQQKQASQIASISTSIPTPTSAESTVESTEPAFKSVAKLSKGRGKSIPESVPNSDSDYVVRHVERAKTYLKQRSYDYAVQELREALRLSPQSPEIHSMLGQTYYKQSLTGMARAHFKQAYRLNPHHRVVRKYVDLLGLTAELEAEALQRAQQEAQKKTAVATADSVVNNGLSSAPKKAWLGKLLGR